MAKSGMSPEQELRELQRKFALLEGDRKAFYETSQATIRQNKDTITTSKKENKDLRTGLSTLQKHGASAGMSFQEAEVHKLNSRVNELKQRYDEIKYESTRKAAEHQGIQDKIADFERENMPVLEEDSPLTRQIRLLENRLDKAMIKFNEAQSIRKTYEQIVKRLREERVGFDNQLSAIEKTLKAKEHDFEELVMMSHDANHARDIAKAELTAFKQYLDEARKARDKELTERRQFVAQRAEMAKRMEAREQLRKKADMERKGDHDKPEEEKLIAATYAQTMQSVHVEHRIEEEAERIAQHEEAFRKIKEATGVSDVNEVIQKFLTQEDTFRNLQDMTKDSQLTIDRLNEEKAQLKAKLEELKYSGSSSLGSRRVLDEFEAHLAESAATLERNRGKYERVAKILINVKAGIEHLSDKLNHVRLEFSAIPMSDDTVVDVLAQCEQKLLKVMETIAADPNGSELLSRSSADLGASGALPSAVGRQVEIPANNIRIKLPGAEEASDDEEESEAEGDEDVLDRDTVKKLASLAVDKATKKPRRKKGKGKGRAESAAE